MNIILCGLPRVGKSTTGKKLAKRLNWDFVDSDNLIKELYFSKYGKKLSCRQIFNTLGEKVFRKLEKEAIFSLKEKTHHVIALGGGALCEDACAKLLKSIGKIIFLVDTIENIAIRAKKRPPAFLDASDLKSSYMELAKKRVPLYKKWADLEILPGKINQMIKWYTDGK